MRAAVTDAYKIRRATPTDLPRVAPLWRRLVEFEASLSRRFSVKPDADRLWLEELSADREAGRADVFLADVSGKLVGFLHVRATRGAPFHAEDRIGFVDGVWIEPDHRRRGLSKRLLAEAELWCRSRRLGILEAGVVIANRDAVAAWEKLGFRMTAATMTRPIPRDPRGSVAKAFDEQAPRIAASPYFTFEKRVRRLVEFARPAPSHRLLDVGCGPGVLLAAFADRVGGRIGVELSREMAVRARSSGADVVLGAAEHLPFRDGAFHRVVSRATLHHLHDAASGLREMARVASPGGAVVVEDLATSEDPERAKRHNELETLRDPSHHRMLAPSEMKRAVAEAGLALDETLTVREPRDLDGWLAISQPAAPEAERVRRLARKYADRAEFDETGLLLRAVGDEVRFDHTHFLLRATKPTGKGNADVASFERNGSLSAID